MTVLPAGLLRALLLCAPSEARLMTVLPAGLLRALLLCDLTPRNRCTISRGPQPPEAGS